MIAAGQSVKINARGRFIRGMASDAPYMVRFDGGPLVQFQTGIAFESPEFWAEVELFNSHTAAQPVEVAISDGFVDDNRLVGQVDISGGIRIAANRSASYGAVTVGTAAVQIRAANENRGSLLVQNNGAAAVFVGADNAVTTGNGIQVGPGGSVSLTIAGAVWARSGAAGNSVRWLEESL